MFVAALTDIEAGEEILIDYGVGYWDHMFDLHQRHAKLVAARDAMLAADELVRNGQAPAFNIKRNKFRSFWLTFCQ